MILVGKGVGFNDRRLCSRFLLRFKHLRQNAELVNGRKDACSAVQLYTFIQLMVLQNRSVLSALNLWSKSGL